MCVLARIVGKFMCDSVYYYYKRATPVGSLSLYTVRIALWIPLGTSQTALAEDIMRRGNFSHFAVDVYYGNHNIYYTRPRPRGFGGENNMLRKISVTTNRSKKGDFNDETYKAKFS